MKHLYIIGNGFDIHTGLATRYADFQLWLENNYPFIYENMQVVYDIDAEWWNDFEVQLGNLDINKFVSKLFVHTCIVFMREYGSHSTAFPRML